MAVSGCTISMVFDRGEKRNNLPCFFRELPRVAELHFPLLGFALRVATSFLDSWFRIDIASHVLGGPL